jgi:hypothetical protein
LNYGISAMKLPNRPDHHKLAFTLAAHFPDYRKNQLELLVLMVFALIQAQTVRHAKLAERFLILTMHLRAGSLPWNSQFRIGHQTHRTLLPQLPDQPS